MSLLVWLPLRDNLNNYGLSDIAVNNNGATANNEGKIGSCYYLNGKTLSYPNFTFLSGKKDFSACCWVKFTAFPSNANAYCISLNTSASNDSKFILGVFSTDKTTASFRLNVGNSIGTLELNTWYHLAICVSGTTGYMYINGQLKNTVSITSNEATNLVIGGRSSNAAGTSFTGTSAPAYYNDIRIYDHCLSPKEVEQTAMGLIAHYKLSADQTNNLLLNTSNPINTNSLVGVPGTCSIILDEFLNQNVFQSSTTNTGETYIYSSRSPRVSQSTEYTFSCDLWVNDYVKSIETFWLSDTEANPQTGTGYAGSSHVTNKSHSIPVRNHWFHLTWTFTTKSDDRTGYIRIDNNGSSTSGTAAVMRVTNLKLEKGNTATPYFPSSSETGFMLGDDSSGYGNHGTATGDFGMAKSQSPRNSGSAIFNGNDYIACGRGPMVRDTISISCWGYMDAWSDYSGRRMLSCTEGGGWNFEPSGDSSANGMCFAIGTGTTSNTYLTAVSDIKCKDLSAGWHHFVGTYDGYVAKIYIDGALRGTSATKSSKTPIYYHSSNGIFIGAEAGGSATAAAGSGFKGAISDVRIYASALNDEMIENLYKVSGSIDKAGSLFVYQLIEDFNTNMGIQKSGNFIASYFDSNGIVKHLSDGSSWLRIFYHKNNSGTVLFTSADEVLFSNTAEKYSRLRFLNEMRGKDGKYEFLLTYPGISGYNRWKQDSNPCEEYLGTSNGSLNATGYVPVEISWTGMYWGGLTRQNSSATDITNCFLSGSTGHSNWYYAIGANTTWGGAIPGCDQNTGVQETELWIRLDTLQDNITTKIMNNNMVSSNNFFEF